MARRWRHTNPEKARQIARLNKLARKRGHRDTDTSEYLQIITGDPCSYCGAAFEHVDHIQPVKLDGENHWTNYTPACRRCNQEKNASSLLTYLLRRVEHDRAIA